MKGQYVRLIKNDTMWAAIGSIAIVVKENHSDFSLEKYSCALEEDHRNMIGVKWISQKYKRENDESIVKKGQNDGNYYASHFEPVDLIWE